MRKWLRSLMAAAAGLGKVDATAAAWAGAAGADSGAAGGSLALRADLGLRRLLAYRWGVAAEASVAVRLRLRGYRILAHRFRTVSGEVDLVAWHRGTIVFVEVKARRGDAAIDDLLPYHAVARIRAAADIYLARHPALFDCRQRFDLAIVGPCGIRHLVDAF